MKKFIKREGTSAIKGQWYEIKLVMLSFIQAIIFGYKFELANNMDMAGAFDDVVINIFFPDTTRKSIFLQAKHVENPDSEKRKINLGDLKGPKGNFSLTKYYTSYHEIMKNKSYFCEKGFNVDEAEFVIYTNTNFDDTSKDFFEEKSKSDTFNIFLSKDVSAYQIKPSKFEEILKIFKPDGKDKEKEVMKYLARLTFLVKQGNESDVEEKIKKCISIKFDEHNQEEISDNYLKAYNDYQSWWLSKGEVNFLTEDDDYFQTYCAVCLLDKLKNFQLQIKSKIKEMSIDYTNTCLKSFASKIGEARSVKLQTIAGTSMLTLSKVLQLYNENKNIMIVDSECVKQYSKKIECNFKNSKVFNILIYYISNNTQPLQFDRQMLDIVRSNCNKTFIVICNEQADCDSDFSVSFKDIIRYCDLIPKAQERVGDTNITFQDKVMYVKDVAGDGFSEMLSEELLAKVLLQEDVKIAKGQKENLKVLNYIPRRFKKYLLNTNIIDTCRNDVLLIETSENDCKYKLCKEREVTFYPKSDPNRKNVFYNLQSSTSLSNFQELCKSHKNVHFLKYNKDELVWQQTHGSMKIIKDNLQSYEVLTEKKIVNCCKNKKLVIISDVAGMGKSTVIKSLANEVNEQCPGLWIFIINLSEHTEVLLNCKEIKEKRTVYVTLLNSLNYSSESERMFLCSMFATGRVAIFLDGFDEISPDYEKIVIKLVEELQNLNVQQIYLTTRPQMQEYIEQNLHLLCFSFVALETQEQANFVISEWIENEKSVDTEKRELINTSANKLIAQMSSVTSENEIAVCGIPLQLKMIVDIYPTFNEMNTDFEENEIPTTLDSVYEKFLEKKFHVYCEEKTGQKPHRVTYRIDLEKHKKTLKEHQFLAIDMIFSDPHHDIILSEKHQEKLQKIYQKPNDITIYGIVSAIYPRKSKFTHRTFAEYLSAMYLCSKLEKEQCITFIRTFLSNILIYSKYQVLRKFLNGMINKYSFCRPLLSLEHLSLTKEILTANSQIFVETPLHVSANEKNVKLLNYLLTDLEPKTETSNLILNIYDGKYTVLQIIVKSSVSSEYFDEIDLLVSLGADVNLRSFHGESVLHLSSTKRNVLEHLLLISKELNLNLVQDDALLAAVQSRNTECMKLLISYGASVNWKNNTNVSLLHIASRHESSKVIECLVDNGAKVDAKDNDGRSALYEASIDGSLETVKCLVGRGANVNEKNNNGLSILHAAFFRCQLDKVKYLLECGANINNKNRKGFSMLHEAALQGNQDRVDCLVKLGANVNDKDNLGRSVLHLAATCGRLGTVKYLLEQDAKVNDKDKYGESVLFAAAINGQFDTVKCLLEHDAKDNNKEKHQFLVLYETAMQGHIHEVKSVIQRDKNSNNKYGLLLLYLAAWQGHLDLVKCLLENGANVNDKDNCGKSVLYMALKRGHLEIVKCLVEHGADVNVKNSDGESVLYEAASMGHLETVELIIEKCANVNDKTNDGVSVLYGAAKKGHLGIVKYLIEHDANVNDKTNDGESVLYVASKLGHLAIVQCLVEHGAKVNDKTNDGESVLYIASKLGHLDIVQCLVKLDKNINDTTSDGDSALCAAARNHHQEVMECLVTHGAEVNDKGNNGTPLLYTAAENGDLNAVKRLIKNGANVNDKNNHGWSALFVAAINEHLDIVKFLVDNRANINEKNDKGKSVLYFAVERQRLNIVKCLVELGANVNDKNSKGASVLHEAASSGYLEGVKYLVKHDADVNDTDSNGRSVLYVAAMFNQIKVVKYLVEHGANVNAKDNDGISVLCTAVKEDRIHIVHYLIDNGANVNDKDNDGCSVLYAAASKGNHEIVEYLVNHRANVFDKDNLGRSILHVANKDIQNYLFEIVKKKMVTTDPFDF